MKTGVICDGISRDLNHALLVMDEFDLEYAELQFVWDKEIGDHSPSEVAKIKDLLASYNKPVSCLSRHIFAGMTSANRPGDALHEKHMDALKRVIAIAHELGSPLVRIMTSKKEQILWGLNGAEHWNVANGAWDTLPPLIGPAIDLARAEGVKQPTPTKSPSSSIFIIIYFKLGLYANALFAGIVHGVVVQIITSLFFIFSILDFLTLKDA